MNVPSSELEYDEEELERDDGANDTDEELKRAIVCLDLDCFYAQVEVLRDEEALSGRPVAVQQRSICVTSTYEARAHGVKKCMLVSEAKKVRQGVVHRALSPG